MTLKRLLSLVSQNRTAFGAALLLAVIVLGILFLPKGEAPLTGYYPEADELAQQAPKSFQEYSTYFRELAEQKGGAYAYEVLKRAPFPQGVDIHLLAHVVGDVLYKQKGIDAIHICTQDFRNACSHSVVIGILNEHGEGALGEIADTCRKAPGGPGAYTMCFHGLGHGVLAYNGYDYEKAIDMCKKTGTPEYQNREAVECVGGMTMEMIAGVHDPDAWASQKERFFKKEDPLYPCTAPFMTDDIRPICYVYNTPHLFETAGMNLGLPDPEAYDTAFSYCDAIPESNMIDRDACYGGFGKEFVVLAQGRDVRDVGSMGIPALTNIRTWCAEAGDTNGEASCNGSALASLFWGGENNPDASFSFCSIATGEAQSRCYRDLSGHISFYLANDPKKVTLCSRLPEAYRSACSQPR